MTTSAVQRILVEAYMVGHRELAEAANNLAHRPTSIEAVAQQSATVARLESAVRKLRSAVDAAYDLR